MIVITSMDSLPEHCYECPCHDDESGYCQADKELRCSDYRPHWCPLKEIHDDQESSEVGMNSTEKAIIDLNVSKNILCRPQMLTPEMCFKIGQVITSAIALLKEREAVLVDTKMIGMTNGTYIEVYCCRDCRTVLDPTFNYCPNCGQAVKWE